MSSVNKVILIGNCGSDPEIKTFQNGGQIATIRLATSEKWRDKNSGEQKERTEWHTVVVNGDGLIGVVDKYVRKATKLYIEGQLKTRKWKDKQGEDRYSTEISVGGPHSQLVLLGGGERGKTERQRQARDARAGESDVSDWRGSGPPGRTKRASWDDWNDPLDDVVPF